MLPTILKNLFSKAATRRYPYVKREPFPGARGKLHFDTEKCNLCGACSKVCPANAITVDKENKVIRYDYFGCIYCGNCVQACPKQAITMDVSYSPPATERNEELIVQHPSS